MDDSGCRSAQACKIPCKPLKSRRKEVHYRSFDTYDCSALRTEKNFTGGEAVVEGSRRSQLKRDLGNDDIPARSMTFHGF